MATRKIEFTERVILSPVVSAKPGTYDEGDSLIFPKEEADEYIRLGWAKCFETGEQGERSPGTQRLQVNSVGAGSSVG